MFSAHWSDGLREARCDVWAFLAGILSDQLRGDGVGRWGKFPNRSEHGVWWSNDAEAEILIQGRQIHFGKRRIPGQERFDLGCET